MRIISTLTILLCSSVLAGQNVLPEVVLVADTRKVQTRESITKEIRQAENTNMAFPLVSKKKLLAFPRCNLGCVPYSKTVDLKEALEGKMSCVSIQHPIKYDKFTIRDQVDKTQIPKATVSFVFPERKDTLRYIADDSGVVVSNSLPKLEGCEMIVSAVGYKTESGLFSLNTQKPLSEIFLTRDVKICPEVIITCFDCTRKISCGGWIKVVRGSAEKIPVVENDKLNLYPNPVAKGRLVNIEYPVTGNKMLLSVTSIDGKMILARPFSAAGREQLETGLWPGGTYIIRLLYANGRQAASQKLVIQ